MKSRRSSIIISFIVFETIVLTSIWDILINVSLGEGLLWLLLYTLFVIESGFIVININFIQMIENYKENIKLFLFLNGRLLSIYVLVVIALLCFIFSVLIDQTYIIFANMVLLGRFSDKPNILYIDNGKLYYSNNRFANITQVKDHKIENTIISMTLVDGKNIRINIKDEKERTDFERAISDLHIKNE